MALLDELALFEVESGLPTFAVVDKVERRFKLVGYTDTKVKAMKAQRAEYAQQVFERNVTFDQRHWHR
jgi:hypothetical protein